MLTWLFGWIWGGLQWLLTPFWCPPLLYKLPKPPQGPPHSAVHTAVFNLRPKSALSSQLHSTRYILELNWADCSIALLSGGIMDFC